METNNEAERSKDLGQHKGKIAGKCDAPYGKLARQDDAHGRKRARQIKMPRVKRGVSCVIENPDIPVIPASHFQ